MTSIIELKDVTKRFGDVRAVDDVSLDVTEGEFLAVLGPSGAGKTTILRMIAGFETPTDGRILLDGQDITNSPPHNRETATVFQNYALFPHLTVRENIEFGLKRNGFSGDEIGPKIKEVLEKVDLPGYEERKPANLSGGQQQRVATARALAIEPKVLLMDEPLGALDKKLRDQLEVEIIELQEELGITTLYVTHNQEEALTMADRVAVMNDGAIEQISSPTEIYNKPETDFVANFIGDANALTDNAEIEDELRLEQNPETAAEGTPQDVNPYVRPEKMRLEGPEYTGPEVTIPGTVNQTIFTGSTTTYYVSAMGDELMVEQQNESAGSEVEFEPGDTVTLVWDQQDMTLVKAKEGGH
ncbi:ABC transporter ATP-binding protein [Halorussus salinisoli]|uniref:ABC transporter ATP-binding protein n=1 Tax=Halorussus salinisoli TaxID=2558242 RepID=UPI0010C1BCE0|nr:ABC transporter ATP-binding protein [Halorussus salinisoli]